MKAIFITMMLCALLVWLAYGYVMLDEAEAEATKEKKRREVRRHPVDFEEFLRSISE